MTALAAVGAARAEDATPTPPPAFEKRPFEFLKARAAEAAAAADKSAGEREAARQAQARAARAWIEAEWIRSATAPYLEKQRAEILALTDRVNALAKTLEDSAAAREKEKAESAAALDAAKKRNEELDKALGDLKKAFEDYKAETAKQGTEFQARGAEARDAIARAHAAQERALGWLKERLARDFEPVEIDGVEFVRVPAGSFTMGSTDDEIAALKEAGLWSRMLDVETPARAVTLSRAFMISRREITQAQWESVMGNNPSAFKGPTLPVDSVTWDDAVAFAKKLSERTGAAYRLPTEAEWEYCARAGGPGLFGAAAEPVTFDNIAETAWFAGNSEYKTHPVGERRPNAWGLHDMAGNVWEWTADAFDPRAYANAPATDPRIDEAGPERVFRGGCYALDPAYLRAANRGAQLPGFKSAYVGFRIAREIPERGAK